MSPLPQANDASIRKHQTFGDLFEATPVPEYVEGFKLDDSESIHDVWPEGTDNAKDVSIDLYLHPQKITADTLCCR